MAVPKRTNRWVISVMIVLALVAGSTRWVGMLQKHWWTHDEAISYLAATGHQSSYEKTRQAGVPPYGSWVHVSAWQHFVEPNGSVSPWRIAKELAAHDIHPPMYFWLLHAASVVFGVKPWTGPALNMIIDVATTLLIFIAGRRIIGSDEWAAIAALLWALSPATLAVSLQARQYSLFGALTISFVLQWLRTTSDGHHSMKQLPLLACLTTMGMLTHYYFFLVMLATSAATALGMGEATRRRSLRGAMLAVAVGVVISVAANPGLLQTFSRADVQSQGFEIEHLPLRILITGYNSFGFVAGTSNRFVTLAVGAIAGALFVLGMLFRRTALHVGWHGLEPSLRYTVTVLLFLTIAIDGLYLAFVSPQHAMGLRYLAPIWPLLAIALAGFGRQCTRGHLIVIGLCCCMLSMSIHAIDSSRRFELRLDDEFEAVLVHADSIVVDSTARGTFLPLVPHLPEGKPLLAAEQQHLLEAPHRWLDGTGERVVLLSSLVYGGSIEKRDALLELFADQGYPPICPPRKLHGLSWTAYQLARTERRSETP